MITQNDIDSLTRYSASKGLAISLYLNAIGNDREKVIWDIETKVLIKDLRKKLESMSADHKYMGAVEKDLEQISHFASTAGTSARSSIPWQDHANGNSFHHAGSPRYKSMAIFANSSDNILRVYRLPAPVKSTITIDKSFYLRPLLAMLEEHHRVGLVLTDSRHARFFEIFMGEILENLDFKMKEPNIKKPLLETLMKRDKHIMQRKEEDIRLHLSSVADVLKSHFNAHHFDKLIIGAHKPLGERLAKLLDSRLHDNLIRILEIDIHASESEILEKAINAEREFELQEENKILRRITDEMERDGRAVEGIDKVVAAIHDYNVYALAVADDFSVEGLSCPQCGMPHLSEKDSAIPTCFACGTSSHQSFRYNL